MNVTLINPRLKTWSPNVYPPLGLTYIAAVLERVGHTVSIIDLNAQLFPDKQFRSAMESSDVVGITGMVTEYDDILQIIAKIKGYNPKAKVILGGALATTWTEKVMASSEADFAVMGEGELIISNLMLALRTESSYKDIRGIAYRDNGKVVINPREDIIKDPDTIDFPARHLLKTSRYTTRWFKNYGKDVSHVKSTTVFSSRGCPYHCAFCYMDMWGHKWRGRSPENVLQEIKLLQKSGFNGFLFYDDTFTLDSKRVLEICRRIQDEKLNIVWHCNGRINLMNGELIEAMSKAGCRGIAYGIESGNQETVNLIDKGITLEQVEKVTKATEQAGIKVTGLFMLGMLGETKDTIRQTLSFARKLNLSFYCFALTVPLLGTKLYDMAREKGLISPNDMKDWSFNANANLTVDCTRVELEQFGKEAFREFNLEKVYGKHYLIHPQLWLDGFSSLMFLAGKRSNKDLVKRMIGIATGR
jgi:radical SAM superfamily enzyme YgiQ (UPF0313 family)